MPDDPNALTAAPRPRLGLDLFWAYGAASAKVLSWVIVLALVKRGLGTLELGILALARATIGIFNYVGVGLAPALIHRMAQGLKFTAPPAPLGPVCEADPSVVAPAPVLSYARPATRLARFSTQVAYSNGFVIALAATAAGLVALWFYSFRFDQIHEIYESSYDGYRGNVSEMVLLLGIGTLLRLLSDVPGSVLHSTGWMWVDCLILTIGELTWAAFACLIYLRPIDGLYFSLPNIARGYAFSGALVLLLRWMLGGVRQGMVLPKLAQLDAREMRVLLWFGGGVLLAQVADYLYAPAAHILIQQLLGPEFVADYTLAVQIDAGLLLLVSGLAMVLLPRAAAAHGRGDAAALRRYYIRGTLISLCLLAITATLVWICSPTLFSLWLGDPMPSTQAILPLVLVHTVIGGSSAPGRSILLGMGKVRAYTASALIAGVMNVVLGYVFLKCGLGLKGVVLSTICVVIARCGLWMPWYILRQLGHGSDFSTVKSDENQVLNIPT